MLISIRAQNFVGLPDQSWPIGRINRVTGKNGAGKTSLGRALVWCLTGLDFSGAQAAAAYMKNSAELSEVELRTTEGQSITRRRMKPSGYLTCDHDRIPDEGLGAFLRISPLGFAVMCIPETFFRLNTAKRRELMLGVTPDEDMQGLFSEMSLCDPSVVDWTRSPRQIFEGANLKRLSLERELAMNAGRLFELERVEEADKPTESLAELEKKRDNIATRYRDCAPQEKALVDQERRAGAAALDIARWQQKDVHRNEIVRENARREEARAKLLDLNLRQSEVNRCEGEFNRASDELQEAERALADWAKLQALAAKGACPTCGQSMVGAPELLKPKKDFDAQCAVARNARHKAACTLGDARELLARDQKANATLGELSPLPLSEIGPCPMEVARPDPTEVDRVRTISTALAHELGELNGKLDAMRRTESSLASRAAEAVKLKGAIDLMKAAYEKAKRIESALHLKTGIWAVALQRKLGKVSLSGYQFRFTETQANGEEKECFKVVRESDGLDVEEMSSGERIKFCMALSCLLADLSGTSFRCCFLEHTDLLDAVPAMPGFQVFAERVLKGTALAVEVVK